MGEEEGRPKKGQRVVCVFIYSFVHLFICSPISIAVEAKLIFHSVLSESAK